MILYDENRPMDEAVESAQGIFQERATPAHYYTSNCDFNIILEDLVSGAIPVNSKQAYPVIWKADVERLKKEYNEQNNLPPFEPPYRAISGTEKLY